MARDSPVHHGRSGEFDRCEKQPRPMERLLVAWVDFGSLPSHSQAGFHSAHPDLWACGQDHGQLCSLCSTRCTALHCCAYSRLKIQLWGAALFPGIQTWTLSKAALQCEGGAGDQHRQEADGTPGFVSQMQQSTVGSAKEDKILPSRVICRCSASLAPIVFMINTRSGKFDWRSLSGLLQKSKFHGLFIIQPVACGGKYEQMQCSPQQAACTMPGLCFQTWDSFVLLFLGRCFHLLCSCFPSVPHCEHLGAGPFSAHTAQHRVVQNRKIRSAESNDCGPEPLHQSQNPKKIKEKKDHAHKIQIISVGAEGNIAAVPQ